jgi:hypothetical protein
MLALLVLVDPIGQRYPVEYPLAFRHRMFRPKIPHDLALEKPHKAARLAVARHVEQFGGSPLEFDGEASPLIEEPASGFNGLPLIRIRNPHRHLALEPLPSVKIGLRHADHRHGRSLFELDVIGFEVSARSGSADL